MHLLFAHLNDRLQYIYQTTAFEISEVCSADSVSLCDAFHVESIGAILSAAFSVYITGEIEQVFFPAVGCKFLFCDHEKNTLLRYEEKKILIVRFEDLRLSKRWALSEAPFSSTGDLAADEAQLLTSKLASEKHLRFIGELTNWPLQR